jgi:cystathionine gamma-synthase
LKTAGAVLIETASNPLMPLIDIEETMRHASLSGAPVIVDNTVATPYNQRPFEDGADWLIHSTSKYLSGHSDLIGGCVVKRQPLTSKDRAVHKNLNGEAVVEWLVKHPAVRTVHYPGTRDASQIAIREKQRAIGLVVILRTQRRRCCGRSFSRSPPAHRSCVSLGGMESLATRPAMSSHRGMTPEARQAAGIDESLIRLSARTEDIHDLIADLDQALKSP